MGHNPIPPLALAPPNLLQSSKSKCSAGQQFSKAEQEGKMSDKFGLRAEEVAEITAVLRQYPAVQTALIFGSRAKQTHKRTSDIDIALQGQGERLSDDLAATIAYQLNEETLLPYHFDVLNYHSLHNPQLIAHINRVGQPLYTAPEPTN
jgi:uncharacterized protein